MGRKTLNDTTTPANPGSSLRWDRRIPQSTKPLLTRSHAKYVSPKHAFRRLEADPTAGPGAVPAAPELGARYPSGLFRAREGRGSSGPRQITGAVTPAIELRIEAVDGFPPPFQVVIARLTRRDSLVDAYASLTEVLDSTGFRRIGELPLDEWVFHLSVAYAGELDGPGWEALLSGCRRETLPAPAERVSSVDFVWYGDDGEHIESIPLQET